MASSITPEYRDAFIYGLQWRWSINGDLINPHVDDDDLDMAYWDKLAELAVDYILETPPSPAHFGARIMASKLTPEERQDLIYGMQTKWQENGPALDCIPPDGFWQGLAQIAVDFMVEEIGERIVKP